MIEWRQLVDPPDRGDRSVRRAAVAAGSALLAITVLAAHVYGVAIGGLVVDVCGRPWSRLVYE